MNHKDEEPITRLPGIVKLMMKDQDDTEMLGYEPLEPESPALSHLGKLAWLMLFLGLFRWLF